MTSPAGVYLKRLMLVSGSDWSNYQDAGPVGALVAKRQACLAESDPDAIASRERVPVGNEFTLGSSDSISGQFMTETIINERCFVHLPVEDCSESQTRPIQHVRPDARPTTDR